MSDGRAELVARVRDWLETPRVNELLIEQRILSALEIAVIYDRLHQQNPIQLAMVIQRVLGNRLVRRRILAHAPDRRVGRQAMDTIRAWADEATRDKSAPLN